MNVSIGDSSAGVRGAASRSADIMSICSTVPAPSSLQHIFEQQSVETVESGGTIFWEGDPATHVFEVVEGVLRVFKLLADGRRVITGFIYPGDILGVALKDHYLYTAEAVSEVKLRRFGRRRFRERVDASPELRPQLFARLCDEMAAAQDQMVLLARRSAEERVCSFLLQIARRTGASDGGNRAIALPMSRLDIADYLGLTIETVSRVMTRLTSRGMIASAGRQAIVIRKPARLESLAGEVGGEDNETGDLAGTKPAVWPN